MPSRPNTPCKHPGCPALVPYGTRYCEKHKPLHSDEQRPANKRGYDHRWNKARKRYLATHPLCAECLKHGRYCQACGYDGEIRIVSEDSKYLWECPNCGNRDQRTMNVCRRTCGYLGTNFFNQGRTQEIAERVLHL